MKIRLGRVLLVGVLILGLAVGLTSIGAEEPKRVLRITFAWPTYIDPAVGSDFSSSSSFVNLYDTLVYPTTTGDVVPHVAESWEVSEDGLTWTFHLRKGIKFHDGTELTAEDVAFSMERFLTIGEGYAYLFMDKIESVEVVDKYTVRFRLTEPYGPFLTVLVRLYILNKECVVANIKKPGPYGEWGDYGKEYLLTHDCGSGPYMVKEFPLEEYLLMERFPDYWGEFAPNAPDEVKFIATTEPVTVRTMMARRELEITDQWQPLESLAALEAMEGVEIAKWFPGTVFFYMIHTRKPPTDDVHFRRAMAWAFDYETVVKEIFPGSRQARGPVAQGFPGHNPEVFQYYRDLDKAMEELRKSKYYDELDKYEVEVHWCAEVPDEEKVALLFMSNMAEIGIKVKIVKTPWLTMIEETADIETSPHIETIFVAPHYAEAGSMLKSRYHSDSAATWEQNEWLLNPAVDWLIDDAIATLDREERFKKYGLIQRMAVDLAWSLFLFDHAEKHAYQATYVDWPVARGEVIPVMGYNFAARFIQVYPEKKP